MLTKEFITPLKGTPYYTSIGIIKAYDRYGNIYDVGEIAYELFDEQNFQYVITPYWDKISLIPKGVFHGISGIDLDIKQEHYYRVNMVPGFIKQRTPSKNREDVKKLMESVGLDYYNRFEWLLRSESRCGDDNLFVVRKEIKETMNKTAGLKHSKLSKEKENKARSLFGIIPNDVKFEDIRQEKLGRV